MIPLKSKMKTKKRDSNLYKHGLPFSQKLGENLTDLVNRIKMNKAAMLIVDGGVGEGKTTLCVEGADFVNSLFGLKPIELKRKYHPQYAMGGEAFLKQLVECFNKKFPCVIYDEAGDFNKRASLTRFNATINRTFETFRAFKILVILSLPSFSVLDNDLLLKEIPRLLIHTRDRRENYGNFQGYSLYRMMYIKEKMKKLVVKSFAYNIVMENFRGQFLDLEPKRSKQLDILSTSGKKSILRKSEIDIEGLMSYATMSNKLGLSIKTLRMKVGKLKLRHKRIINRVKYFDNYTLDRLADESGRR